MNQDDMKEDEKTLQDLIDNLNTESDQLKQTLVDIQEKVQKDTAHDMAVLDGAEKDMEAVQQQAYHEENQGQIATVKTQIDDL